MKGATPTLDEKAWYGRMLVEYVLAVEVPMISAVNGPCNGMAPLDRPWDQEPWSD